MGKCDLGAAKEGRRRDWRRGAATGGGRRGGRERRGGGGDERNGDDEALADDIRERESDPQRPAMAQIRRDVKAGGGR